jgi:hypothetical protein
MFAIAENDTDKNTLIEVGTRLHCILYGGKDGTVYNINGEQRPETIREVGGGLMVTGGNATFDIVWDNGSYSKGTPESIARGVQWFIYPDVKRSLIEIEMAKRHADNVIRQGELDQEEAAKQRELEKEILKLAKPHLKQFEERTNGKHCAVNIRIELKKAFKGVKFSVRSDYSSVRVHWTDGPTIEQVDAVVQKYQSGSFNGYEDIYEYNSSPFNDVFGGVQYVFTERHYSTEASLNAIDVVFEKYNYKFMQDVEKPTAEEYENGEVWRIQDPDTGQSLTQLIGKERSKLTF